jgi:hypothetical protein
MAKIEASELIQPITDVLMNASTGKGTERGFLTGYQILKRLSQPLQEQLRAAYGDAGTHGGNRSVLQPACRRSPLQSKA